MDRTTAAELSPVLGDAVAAHVVIATDVLGAAGVGEQLASSGDAVLRGLGYLTIDADAAAAVQRAVDARTSAVPLDVTGTDPTAPARAVAIRSAFVAAREYAQRLDYAIEGYVAMADAVDREFTYDVAVLPVSAYSEIAGPFPGASHSADLAEGAVDAGAWLLNADGSWELGPDEGLVFDREDAAAAVAPLHANADPAGAEMLGRQARAAFDRTLSLLGHPEPPPAPAESLTEVEPPGPSSSGSGSDPTDRAGDEERDTPNRDLGPFPSAERMTPLSFRTYTRRKLEKQRRRPPERDVTAASCSPETVTFRLPRSHKVTTRQAVTPS